MNQQTLNLGATRDYGNCPKKRQARQDTIITQYRKYFGHSLPEDKQYWTMCGNCTSDDGTLNEGSELGQLVSEGLITYNQFHGVEIETDIYNKNILCNDEANWYCGDFHNTLSSAEKFNPGLVNCDLIYMPKIGAIYLAKIMALLHSAVDEVLLIGNFILRTRHHVSGGDDIIRYLDKCPQFHVAYDSGQWIMNDAYYWYMGTGGDQTKMGTVIFVKK